MANTLIDRNLKSMKYFIVAIALFGLGVYLVDYRGVGLDFTSMANAKGTNPVVVELYTSQSCSSCPPADKFLGELAENDNVITLGCHVTYWNHLHWKDTLSNEECTKRQRQFNGDIGSGRVYTPQMVINGEHEFVGSKRSLAAKYLERSAPIFGVNLTNNNGTITASLDHIKRNKNMIVEWIEFDQSYHQDIPSGENRGRSLTYTTPVQSITYETAHTDTNQLSYTPKRQGQKVAVLIRESKAGKIIAAGQIKL